MMNKHCNMIKLSRFKFALLMTAVFATVHLCFYLKGIRFDSSTLTWFWQYLDMDLYKNHLSQSLWYLHSQPPLFNLFLGTIIKLFPTHYPLALHCIYISSGLALYLALFEIQTMLAIPRWVAFGVCAFFIIEPSFILYEHWLFYTLPVTALLTLSILMLAKFVFSAKSRFLWGFFGILLLICGIRSMFHLIYLIAIAALAIVVFRENRRKVFLAAIVPILLIAALYGKNACLFGNFGASSWLGIHVWDIVTTHLPTDVKNRLVADGKISPVVMVKTFGPLDRYHPKFLEHKPAADVPVLTSTTKTNGERNLNHFAYIHIAREYFTSSVYVITHYPLVYVKSVAEAWFYYLQPSSELPFLYPNLEKISGYNNLFSYQLYQKTILPQSFPVADKKYLFPVLILAFPLLLLYSVVLLLRVRDTKVRIILGLICFNLLYISILGNCLETYENNRFRFMLGPMFAILAGLFFSRAVLPRVLRGAKPSAYAE